MISISRSQQMAIVYGKVVNVKPGSGRAANDLTIVTISEVDSYGNIKENGEVIKVLFWNSKPGAKYKNALADKARQFSIGEYMSAKVFVDIGVETKATGVDLKRAGLHSLNLTEDGEKKEYVLHGKVAKIAKGEKYIGIYVPIPHYDGKTWSYKWYVAKFWKDAAASITSRLRKNDTVLIRGSAISDESYNGKPYTALQGIFVRIIHN